MVKFEEISDQKYKSRKCDDWKIRSIIVTKAGDYFISPNGAWLEREDNDCYSKEKNTYVLRPGEHKLNKHNWVKATFEPEEIAHVRDLYAVPEIIIDDTKERLIKRFCKEVCDIDPRLTASLVFLQGKCQKVVIGYCGTDFANVAWTDAITSYVNAQTARQIMPCRYLNEVNHLITKFTDRLVGSVESEINND